MAYPTVSVAQVEQVISQLYGGANAQFQKSAQEYIQNFQKQEYAWELASQLLASQSINSQFIGAHTFQVKISRDWNTLTVEKKRWLRTELLGWIVRLSNGPGMVITKLCLSLTAYALQAVPDIWSNFIMDFFETLHSASIQNSGQPMFVELPVLEFLTVVPEEVLRADLVGERKAKVNQELIDATPRVLSTLKSLLSSHQAHQERDVQIKQKSLKCLQSWILYGVPFESLYPLIDDVINLFPIESTNDQATEVLVEFLSQPRITSYQNTVCGKMLDCLTSEWAKTQIMTAVNDSNEAPARNLCRLLTTFGDSFSDYIAIHFLRQDVMVYLEMMLIEMPLQFWYLLHESLVDSDVIPVNGGDDSDGASSSITLQEAQKIRETSIVVFRRLSEILRSKVQYPPDDEWSEWLKDVKERFKIYRRDVGDTLMNSYYILRNQMLAFLVDLAAMQLNAPGRDPSLWQDLESTLFCLNSIAEAVDYKENVFLPRLFGPDVFEKLPTQGNYRLRNTALSLIGSYAEWLKNHPRQILFALNYIVPALGDSETAFTASLSFKEVCDICRDSLVNDIDGLMHIYVVVGPHIQPREKQKVIESIADVIQKLPPEKMIAPLSVITDQIIQTLREVIMLGKQVLVAVKSPSETVITHLEYLTCCCRGIQPPDDEVITLDENERDSQNGEISISQSRLSGALSDISNIVAETWDQDDEVIEFINTGVRTTANLLSIPFEVIISIVQISYLRSPHSCLLDTAAQVVTVFGSNNRYSNDLRNMLGEITTITIQQYVRNQSVMEQYPDLFLQKCPILLYTLPSELFSNIMKFSIAGLGLQERLALKSAVAFMSEFVGQHYEDERLSKGIESVIMTYGMEIMRELISGIGGRLPRSFVISLSHVLYKMTGRYIEASREWLNLLLTQPVFVFDGGAPELKRTTLKERRRRRVGKTNDLQKTAEKILAAQLKIRAMRDIEGSKSIKVQGDSNEKVTPDDDTSYYDEIKLNPQRRKKDEYDLPPIPGSIDSMTTEDDPRLATADDLRRYIKKYKPDNIDTHSEAFQSLPLEVQYEVVGELRLKTKLYTAMDFSKLQIKNLVRRNELTQKMLDVTNNAKNIKSSRIASERNREYVLMKNEGTGYTMMTNQGSPFNYTGSKGLGTLEEPLNLIDSSESEDESELETDGEESEVEEVMLNPEDVNNKPSSPQSYIDKQEDDFSTNDVDAGNLMLNSDAYVDDEETIDSVMEKFHTLESKKRSASLIYISDDDMMTGEPNMDIDDVNESFESSEPELFYALWLSQAVPEFKNEYENHEDMMQKAIFEWDESEIQEQDTLALKKLGKIREGDDKKEAALNFWLKFLRAAIQFRKPFEPPNQESDADSTLEYSDRPTSKAQYRRYSVSSGSASESGSGSSNSDDIEVYEKGELNLQEPPQFIISKVCREVKLRNINFDSMILPQHFDRYLPDSNKTCSSIYATYYSERLPGYFITEGMVSKDYSNTLDQDESLCSSDKNTLGKSKDLLNSERDSNRLGHSDHPNVINCEAIQMIASHIGKSEKSSSEIEISYLENSSESNEDFVERILPVDINAGEKMEPDANDFDPRIRSESSQVAESFRGLNFRDENSNPSSS
ncbi:9963_t:CDS:10, partial [Acaulospora colombiana]